MYIGKTKYFLCFLSLYLPHPSFPFFSKPFLFYHQITQRSLVSVVFHGSDLLIHNQLDAFSADSEIDRMAFLFFSPILPSRLRILHEDLHTKPRQSTSNGWHAVRHLLDLQCSTSSWYFSSFLSQATPIFSSHRTVSSISTTCFVSVDQRMKSGCWVVVAIWTGTFNRSPISTLNCQSRAVDS